VAEHVAEALECLRQQVYEHLFLLVEFSRGNGPFGGLPQHERYDQAFRSLAAEKGIHPDSAMAGAWKEMTSAELLRLAGQLGSHATTSPAALEELRTHPHLFQMIEWDELGTRATKRLKRRGIGRNVELVRFTLKELLTIRGIGDGVIEEIEMYLASRELTLAGQ
jgi:DNA-directed RNA polymerase alpha subunit